MRNPAGLWEGGVPPPPIHSVGGDKEVGDVCVCVWVGGCKHHLFFFFLIKSYFKAI